MLGFKDRNCGKLKLRAGGGENFMHIPIHRHIKNVPFVKENACIFLAESDTFFAHCAANRCCCLSKQENGYRKFWESF